MKYLSICSGIEAATCAWHGLGWTPVAFAEIEAFPAAVLAHHYPDVPNLGDLTRYDAWPAELLAEVDVLVGGTPCQAFSVAGARRSFDDDRGNLTLDYARLLDRIDRARALHRRPPAVCLWENVPGVLNTPDNAYGCFLGLLAGEDDALSPPGGRWTDAGYVRGPGRAIAWRCLDAQYFRLAQRRDRVFVVAGAGEGFRPEEILFEREGLRRDSPPRRGAGEGTAPTLAARSRGGGGLGTDAECDGALIPEVAGSLTFGGKAAGSATGQDAEQGLLVPVCLATGQAGAGIGIGTTLNCNHEAPIVFDTTQITSAANRSNPQPGAPCHALGAGQHPPLLAFRACGQDGFTPSPHVTPPVAATDGGSSGMPCIAFSGRARGDDGRGYDRPPQVFDGGVVGAIDTMKPHCVAFQTRGSNLDTNGVLSGTLGSNADRASGGAPCVAFSCKDHGADAGELAPTLRGMGHDGSNANGGGQVAVAFNARQDPDHWEERTGPIDTDGTTQAVSVEMQVRRLTPRECERLQGFPGDYTLIPYRGGEAADGPRYKALGNSMAVPVMRWIGERIAAFLRLSSS